MIELPALPNGIRTLTNDELARLRVKFPRLPSSPAQCPTCRGKGSFKWWVYEGSERHVDEYKCDCTGQWLMHLYLLNANIGDVYQRLSWVDTVGVEQAAVDKALTYIDNSDAYVHAGFGLIFYGEMRGTGKTMLTSMVLKQLLADGHDGYFTTFSEMIDHYTGGWYDADSKAWFHRRIKNTEVLAIDDIGREYQGRQQTDLPRATFDEVFRHRVSAATPTLVTTNYDMTKVTTAYGDNVMSLLRERATTYRFTTAQDFRDNQRMRTDEEIRAGLTRPVTIG